MRQPPPRHVEITELMVRFYVFLRQHLDRCEDQQARLAYPDQELQAHLARTRADLQALLAVNPVVQRKLDEECERVLALVAACLPTGPATASAREELRAARAVLMSKTLALSDLLAVFRAS